MGYHPTPILPAPVGSKRRWPCHRPRATVCTSSRRRRAKRRFTHCQQSPGCNGAGGGWGSCYSSYLFGLALETLFRLIWPPSRKCRLAGLNHEGVERVHLAVAAHFSLDCCHDCPSTRRRVLQVFFEGVVVLLPPIKRLVAQKADHIIGTFCVWLEEESGFRKLLRRVSLIVVELPNRGCVQLTATGERVLCGHVRTLAVFSMGCGIWKDASLFS